MNSYTVTLKVKVETEEEINVKDLEESINEDFPSRVLLNEEDWNETVIIFDSFEVTNIEKE